MTTHKEQRQHRYSWQTYTWPLTRNRDNIDIPDTYIHDHSQGTETTSIFLTHIYMTTHKEQRQHRYCWPTYTWPLTRNRDYIDIPDTYIHDHSQGTETTSIFLTDIYMTTHKQQRQHWYSWHIYTWHSEGTETTSIFLTDLHMTTHKEQRHIIFLTHIYMTTHKEQRQHRYSWETYTWPLTSNRDNIDIPDTYIHDSEGTETTSIFLTDIHMTTHKEQRQHRYSWHTYTWPLTRNRDNIDIPDRHIHDHSQGTETTSIFLNRHIHDRHMNTHKEQRYHRYSWQTYTWPHNKEQRQHRYSWQTYTWPLTRNRDIPDTDIHDHSQGTETTSIFLTHIYMTTHKEQRQHRYSWHTYIHDHSQGTETTSIFLTHIYMTTQQGTETTSIFLTHIYMTTHKEQTTSIFLTHIYMTTHKEQRLHRYSWHTYTWPLTRNRDYIDIPDTHIHDHLQGTETTSIFLTHIYMTTHKEQRQHRYSWHTYTWSLTRNIDNIDIPDTHIHDHSQGTETTSIFLTHIYMTTHKEQRQHRYSWHIYTWPLTRNRDNIDIPDRHIHDHSQGTETTSIFLTHIYMTTHKVQRQHRYSWHTYT